MRWLPFCTLLVLLMFGFVFWDIFAKGAGALSWEFLLTNPRKGMTEGGILPAVVGTTYVTLLTALFAVPFGVAAAIYLNEYAQDNQGT
jgi:phosphate transport system permease protein